MTFLVIFLSCRHLTSPIFPRRLSSVLSKFSHKNNFQVGCHPPGGCHPWRWPLPCPTIDATDYTRLCDENNNVTNECLFSQNLKNTKWSFPAKRLSNVYFYCQYSQWAPSGIMSMGKGAPGNVVKCSCCECGLESPGPRPRPGPHRGSAPGPRWETSVPWTPSLPTLEKILGRPYGTAGA